MSGIKENFKALIGMQHDNRYAITASEAKARSIYGSAGQRSRYITSKLELFSQKIRDATELKKFAIVEKLEPDYSDILSELIDYYRSQGFGVKLIDRSDIPELYDDRYIVIAWKDIKDEKFSSDSPGNGQKVLDLEIDGDLRDHSSV
jgi:hypothetical protein